MTDGHSEMLGNQVFQTGAVRDTDIGKPRPDLISPVVELQLANWLSLGAKKYGDRNWEQGIPVSRSYASLRRHLLAWANGRTDEPHMIAVMCNAMFIAHTQEMVKRGRLPSDLDDMPDYKCAGTD